LNTRGKEAAALALHRFGFGASRDSITAIAADPRGALLSDLDRPGAGFLAVKLPSSAAAARAVSDFRAEEQAKSKLAQRAKKEAEAMGMASASDAAASTPPLSTLMSMPKPSEPPLPQRKRGPANRHDWHTIDGMIMRCCFDAHGRLAIPEKESRIVETVLDEYAARDAPVHISESELREAVRRVCAELRKAPIPLKKKRSR